MVKTRGVVAENKRSRRMVVLFDTKLFTCGKRYEGVIANLSTFGIGVYIKTSHPEEHIDCNPGSKLDLIFQTASDGAFYLHCRVKWLNTYTIPPHEILYSMGLEVTQPPLQYKEFIKHLLTHEPSIPV